MTLSTESLSEDIEQPPVNQETNDSQEVEKKENDKEENFRAFREQRKREQEELATERERNKKLEEDQTRRAKELEDMKLVVQSLLEKKQSYDDEEDEEQKRIQKQIDTGIQKYEDSKRKQDDERRFKEESLTLKEKMPDLMEVCSPENISYLEYYHPEIAIPLGKMPDGFEKTKLAYQAIKKHVKMAKKEKEQIEKNMSKPKSVYSSYSNESQKEDSSPYTSEKKRTEVWNKMQRLISGEDED